MKTAKMLNRISLLTIPKIIIMGLLFLILFANLIVAQSQSPKAGQWKNVGGKIAFSGEHSFKNEWHVGNNNMYWKNDEDRIKTPPTHPFDNEVKNDVIVKIGQITVRGPGHIGAFVRSIRAGTTSSLTFSKTGKEFWTAFLGRQELLGSGDNWNWQDIIINDFDTSVPNKGWVPANKTLTLDVWATSEHTRGTWFQGYAAPRGVECEYWFFPGKGGKVIEVKKYGPKGKEIDVTPGEIDYSVPHAAVGKIKSGKVFNETTKKWLKPGDTIRMGHRLTTGVNEGATITLYDKLGIVQMKKYSQILIRNKTRKTKRSSIYLAFGRLLSLFQQKTPYKVETYNSVAGVEGTEFETAYDAVTGKTTVTVWDGTVSLTCKNNNAPPTMVNAGMQATMDNNCNQTVSILSSDNNTSAKAGWDITDDQSDSDISQIASIADSHVYAYSYRNWNKANLGKYNILRAGWLPTGGEKRAYLKFDLSGVNLANVGKATLNLFHNYTGGNNSLSLGVHRVTGSWQEGSDTYHSGQTEKTAKYGEISWVNQPPFEFNSIAYFNPGTGTNKWVEVDITPLVNAWLSGTPNYGLVIKPRGIMSGRSPISAYGFYSREFEDVDKRPVLVLSGSGSVSPPEGGLRGDVIDHFSVAGIWDITQSNGFKGKFNLQQDLDGRLTGTATWGGHLSGTVEGRISGSTVEFTINYSNGISGIYKGTLSQDGTKIVNGTSISSTNESAGWEASISSITGNWNITQSNGYKGKLNLKQGLAGRLTGTATWGGHLSGTVEGIINGNTVEFTVSYSNGISGLYKGTLSQDGTKIVNGTSISSTNESAGWDASK